MDIYGDPEYLEDRNERIKLVRESENEDFKKKEEVFIIDPTRSKCNKDIGSSNNFYLKELELG